MKVEIIEGQLVLKEVYNSITLETREGKQLHICMRDFGFEVKIGEGPWHQINNESDFRNEPKGFSGRDSDFSTTPNIK